MSFGTVAITPIPIPRVVNVGLLPLLPRPTPPTGGWPLGYEGGGGLGIVGR